MRYIKQFGIILFLSFLGEVLNHCIPLPIPASIYGLVLMFFCLHFGIFPLEAVRETGHFLVEIMPLMFIPPAVGLLGAWDVIRANLAAYLIIALSTTVLVMAAAGRITQFLMHRKEDSRA